MADPVTNAPEEARVDAFRPRRGALSLLRRRDLRLVYVAVSASELGNAFQYIALMWFGFEAGGPLGVLAVRLADSVPALGPPARADSDGPRRGYRARPRAIPLASAGCAAWALATRREVAAPAPATGRTPRS